MVGASSEAVEYSNLNADNSLRGNELPFFFNNLSESAKKVPQLTESVIDSFGKILDIFEEPVRLREPEFNHTEFTTPQNVTLVKHNSYENLLTNNDYKPSTFDVEYLGKRTKAHYDRVESPELSEAIEVDKERLKASASPCPEDIHLCGKCFISLASVRCDTCMVYYCAVCANNVHSDVLNRSHTLFATKSDRLAQYYSGNEDNFDLSISLNKDMGSRTYEDCERHPNHHLMYACATCHFLPVCTMCLAELHRSPGNNHNIVDVDVAVTEVKEFVNDCLSALVDRHNALSPVIPELDHLSHMSEETVRAQTRSLRCALQGVMDALKVKQMMVEGEITNLQQLGSSNLNRFLNLSTTYNKYLLGKIDQLRKLANLKDPGLGLNAFVEMRSNFEQLLYHNEDLPDLALEIPHWQLNVGNLPNLLSEMEYRINSRCEDLNSLCNLINHETTKAVAAIDYVLNTDIAFPQPEEPVVKVEKHDDGIKTYSELRAVFSRKDYVHRLACKKAVTLREHYMYVFNSDSHFEGATIESKIDLSAVTVKSFDEEDVTEPAKLARVGCPNGFEVVERKRGQMRYWLFMSESRNLVLLWVSKLKKVAAEHYRVDLARFGIDKNFVLPVPPKPTKEFTKNKAYEYETVRSPNRDRSRYSSRDPSVQRTQQDFKEVSEALRKIKEDSSLIYDKCFQKKNELSPKHNEPESPMLELVESEDQEEEQQDAKSEAGSLKSAGRYDLPSPKVVKSGVSFRGQPISLKCLDLPEFEYSPQVTSPKSIHKFFQNASNNN